MMWGQVGRGDGGKQGGLCANYSGARNAHRTHNYSIDNTLLRMHVHTQALRTHSRPDEDTPSICPLVPPAERLSFPQRGHFLHISLSQRHIHTNTQTEAHIMREYQTTHTHTHAHTRTHAHTHTHECTHTLAHTEHLPPCPLQLRNDGVPERLGPRQAQEIVAAKVHMWTFPSHFALSTTHTSNTQTQTETHIGTREYQSRHTHKHT